MKPSQRRSRRVLPVLLIAAGLAMATACAPSTAPSQGSSADNRTGTLRVWLFQEVDNGPKQKVVGQAVSQFTKAHPGAKVDVTYIPVDTRAEKMKAAFDDPKSAPDVVEFGNTDTAGYVADGGLADISSEFGTWADAKNLTDSVKASVSVSGKVYGVPWFVGVRALYYRTDIFRKMGLTPPTTQAGLAATAKEIRARNPQLYGVAAGAANVYAMLPFVWSAGGDVAREEGGGYRAAIDSAAARKGVTAYTSLITDANCPPAQCAAMGGDAGVQAFASGKAAMAIGGDYNHQAVEAGAAKGEYDVVPLPGLTAGSVAPAFAGGNNLGVMRSTAHRTLAVDFVELLGGSEYQQKMFDAMGDMPALSNVQSAVARQTPWEAPFVRTLQSGTRFVPVTPAWSDIDSQGLLATMMQQIVSGKESVDQATSDAAKKMDALFASAG